MDHETNDAKTDVEKDVEWGRRIERDEGGDGPSENDLSSSGGDRLKVYPGPTRSYLRNDRENREIEKSRSSSSDEPFVTSGEIFDSTYHYMTTFLPKEDLSTLASGGRLDSPNVTGGDEHRAYQNNEEDEKGRESENNTDRDYTEGMNWNYDGERELDPVGENLRDVLSRLNTVAKKEILQTVNFMEFRKYSRTFRGQYRPLSRSRVVIVFVLLIFLVGILSVNYCENQIILGIKWPQFFTQPGWDALQWFILSVVAIVILYALAKTQTAQSLRWSLYLSYFFFGFILVILIARIFTNSSMCDAGRSSRMLSSQPRPIKQDSQKTAVVRRVSNSSKKPTQPATSKKTVTKQNSQSRSSGHQRQLGRISGVRAANEIMKSKSIEWLSMVSTSVLLYAYMGLQSIVILATMFFIFLYPKCVKQGYTSIFRSWKVAACQVRPVIVPLLPSDTLPSPRLPNEKAKQRSPARPSSKLSSPGEDPGSGYLGYAKGNKISDREDSRDRNADERWPSRDRYRVQSSGYFVHVRYRRWIGRLWNLLCCIPCLRPGAKHKRRWKSNLYGHSCFYVGEVDSLGRAHGCGRWVEESYHGEILVGYWKHGEAIIRLR